MNPQEINLSQLQSKVFELNKPGGNPPVANLFGDRGLSYFNEYAFYLTYFNVLPNHISQSGIDCKKANAWFIRAYKDQIKDFYFSKRSMKEGMKPEYDDFLYVLYDDLVVVFDTGHSTVALFFRRTEIALVERVVKDIGKFNNKSKKESRIFLLVDSYRGYLTKALSIIKPKLDLDDNYNDDFKDAHKIIHKRLSRKNDKGIVLLHGKPGTGKTSYIRYLICSIKKNVFFLPPKMAGSITDPELVSIIIDNPNSIFVIEDAENIVIDREADGPSGVSALLNVADGLLSDCLNIQIICSFNTDISRIDNALMRRGRLIAKYEFKELTAEKATSLSQKLGYSRGFCEPMTLTAVYNQEDRDYQHAKGKFTIGFKSLQAN